MGIQMACAYVGTTFLPPLFGWLAGTAHMGIYPVYLLLLVVLMAVTAERMNSIHRKSA